MGERIAYGDDDVVPNGSGGTTATAQITDLSTGATVPEPLAFNGSTALPNHFGATIPYNPDLIGRWTLTFTNSAGGSDNTVSVKTGSLVGVTPPPFASNVTVSGSKSQSDVHLDLSKRKHTMTSSSTYMIRT